MDVVIARVPPHWQHPTVHVSSPIFGESDHFKAMTPVPFETAAREWDENEAAWNAGTHPDILSGEVPKQYIGKPYAIWGDDRPDAEFRVPWREEEATWFQLWEQTSEGTPVTPPFETVEELAEHLATYGEDYSQTVLGFRCGAKDGPWSADAIERLVERGFSSNPIIMEATIPSPFGRP